MSAPESLAALGLAVAVTLAAGTALAVLRPRALADDPERAGGAVRERKLQARAVPAVGGAAVLAGLGAAELAFAGPLLGGHPSGAARWAALGLALAVGLVDDARRGGLGPGAKLAGQVVAAAALAAGVLAGGGTLLQAAGWGAYAVLAMNALNTFDNADGCCAGTAALGLACAPSAAAGAALGFLPLNLLRAPGSRGGRGPASVPFAYLGDSGSHVLGMLVACVPAAWPALAVPLLDLARVSWLRLRARRPPWLGDRRHLAHRLQERGLGPPAVALALTLAGAPAAAGGAVGGGPVAVAAGLLGTLLLFAGLVRLSGACPRPPAGG